MSQSFSNLSPEGKLSKVEHHLGNGHPVQSVWVQWMVEEFVPPELVGEASDEIVATPFHDLDRDDRIAKLKHHLDEGVVPAPWVSWLLHEFAPWSHPADIEARTAPVAAS
jgi:hypothetical protein